MVRVLMRGAGIHSMVQAFGLYDLVSAHSRLSISALSIVSSLLGLRVWGMGNNRIARIPAAAQLVHPAGLVCTDHAMLESLPECHDATHC